METKAKNRLSSAEIYRFLGLNDGFFFAKEVLGFDRLVRRVHGRWIENFLGVVEKKPKGKFKVGVFLHPREHYKTTIYTIALPLFLQKRYNFNLRILVVHSKVNKAIWYVNAQRELLRRNRNLKFVWGYEEIGDIVEKANDDGIWFKRDIYVKEPSIAPGGVLGEITGGHYDIIVCDDLVTIEDRRSATLREKKKEWVRSLFPILNSGGSLFLIGTRWHKEDVYSMYVEMKEDGSWGAINEEDEDISVVVESLYEINENGEKEYLLSEEWNEEREKQTREKMTFEFFSSQYLNRPGLVEGGTFDFRRLVFFKESPAELMEKKRLSMVCAVDPALGKAGGDFSGVVVIGRDVNEGIFYVLEAKAIRKSLKILNEEILRLNRIYNFSKVVVEVNHFQSVWARELLLESRRRGMPLPLLGIHNRIPKSERIEALVPVLENGTIRIWDRLVDLKREMEEYDEGGHDDVLDALEMAFRVASKRAKVRVITAED